MFTRSFLSRASLPALALVFFVGINVFFYYLGYERIVAFVGVEHTYLVTFVVAVATGLSSLTGAALPTTLTTFAAGGASPLLLGFVGGLGTFIADSIFFHLALYGRRFAPSDWSAWIGRLEDRVRDVRPALVLLMVFLYILFSPFPNDLMMILLVLAGYRYRAFVWPLLIGSITHALIYAYFGFFFL